MDIHEYNRKLEEARLKHEKDVEELEYWKNRYAKIEARENSAQDAGKPTLPPLEKIDWTQYTGDKLRAKIREFVQLVADRDLALKTLEIGK